MLKSRSQLMVGLLAVADLAAVAVAWLIAYGLRLAANPLGLTSNQAKPLAEFLLPIGLSLAWTVVIFNRAGLYGPKRTKTLWLELAEVSRSVAVAWALTYVFVSLAGQDEPISRLMMLFVLGVWLVLAAAGRLSGRVMLRWARRRGLNIRSAAIVGAGRLAQKLVYALRTNNWTGIAPLYFVDDDPGRKLLDLDVHGPIDSIDELLASNPVDIVFLALPGSQYDRSESVLDRLAMRNVDVRIVPDLLSVNFLRHDVASLDNLSIITLTYSPQHGWNALLKRVFDVVVSAAALAVLAAPMLLIAAAIKLTSRGPVFYRQRRASLNGKEFDIIKFRTMVADAEAATGAVWAQRGDPRVTRIGRLLRSSSLDELPQFINVLRGQMSLVGPRPERPELIERFRKDIPRYMLRHQVKAGLTGWAQIHGLRGNTSLRKRVQYDLYYIMNWTFGLDLRILLLTPFRGLINPNAY